LKTIRAGLKNQGEFLGLKTPLHRWYIEEGKVVHMNEISKNILRMPRSLLIKLTRGYRILFYKAVSDNVILGNPIYIQPVLVEGPGRISAGVNCRFGVSFNAEFYSGYCFLSVRTKEASIKFGNNIWLNNNVNIVSEGPGIEIGDDCLIGANVSIWDSDFHNIDPTNRFPAKNSKKAVKIGKNVWIGSNVTVLKGTTIGDNSVIAAGSVAFGKIKRNSAYGGNPIQFMFEL
jgi:acetyltransferase-like isoleucine patch superfamily enzyme